ncbi:type II toxin-antitoxin system VapC family toxin [Craurococcus roseus]|uniref:Ribonuclease VapC n=1 Tax=Craurococcus roseus TaxID=77585 RepID=A0ABN1GBI8_9PROT
MRLLDTGVLSELMRPTPDPRVQRWADRLPHHAFCTAATVAAELRFGVELLPAGQRRRRTSHAVDRVLRDVLGRRILPFDLTSARHCAVFRAARQQAGRPVSVQAAMIVATAVAHRVEAIVTRDLDGFEGCGLLLIDPWAA